MKENNSIPEPEVFTSEIEDTIDDLFKPSKKIEIDPLTQEIKEVAKETDDPPVEFELASETTGPQPEETTALLAEEPEIKEEQQEQDALLELELEVEEDDKEAEEIAVELEPVAEDPGHEDKVTETLQQLKQQIFTIEWEVTGPQLDQTLALVAMLQEVPEIKRHALAHSLVVLMKDVLQHIQFHPEKVSATAPSVLKKAIEFLFDCHGGKNVSSDKGEHIAQELKALFEKPVEKEEAELAQFLLLDKVQEDSQEAVGSESVTETPPQEDSSGPPPSAPKDVAKQATDVQTTEAMLPEEGQKLLKAHLIEIKRCINRIEPLERLLAKTPGMEKLHGFQSDIRQRLERQLDQLSNYFFKGAELKLPEAVPNKTEEKYARDMNLALCPWKELFTINLDGMEIGLPTDEIAYVSTPPWHSRSAIKKAQSLALNKLKAWPWSKLKALFSGKLAKLDESSLSAMSFPIVRQLGGQQLPLPSGFTVILLFNGKTGAAILADEKPIRIEIPKEAKWTEKRTDGLEAEIDTNGNVIKVATADSLTQE